MKRKVSKEVYQSVALSSGGMVFRIASDAIIFDMWGRRLALREVNGNVGRLWFGVRQWLKAHPEAGVLVEEPWSTTLEEMAAWIKARRELYADLDEADRAAFVKAMYGG